MTSKTSKPAREIEHAVIRFVGDSGDGMQLTGTEMTRATALAGCDVATFPDYPSEIRAPAGSIAGVSGFQLHLASRDIFSPGDECDTLVAMNPAALKVHLPEVRRGGVIVVNTAAFSADNLEKAHYKSNPLDDPSLKENYRLIAIDFDKVMAASEGPTLQKREIARARNFFALGFCFWLYSRETEGELKEIQKKFAKKPEAIEINTRAFLSGYNYGETSEQADARFYVPPAPLPKGKYRNITGNAATALGLVAAAERAGMRLFLGSYPITPATDVLHELAKYRRFNVTTHQAEDEIAGVCSAIGASFAGALAATNTSGPGMALKTEAIGLAVIMEVPLVIVNVQRGGPSTGLPTKTEQSDLFQAVYGRNGECPLPVLAARSPADCFDATVEAARIAVDYRTPVILLTDGFIGNSSEPWLVPDIEKIPRIDPKFRTDPNGFTPYVRDPETLARAWAVPGTPGLEHRIGGLEKDYETGNVNYDGPNHEKMVRTRAQKVDNVAKTYKPLEVYGDDSGLLVIAWGGTYGAVQSAVDEARAAGNKIGFVHLRHIFPLPPDLAKICSKYQRILVPEINMGQLRTHIRAQLGIETEGFIKVQTKTLPIQELVRAMSSGKPAAKQMEALS